MSNKAYTLFVSPNRKAYTLFVFPNRKVAATDGGFTRNDGTHPKRPDWKAWWPSRGESMLRGPAFRTVIFHHYWWDGKGEAPNKEYYHLIISRTLTFGDDAVIVEM